MIVKIVLSKSARFSFRNSVYISQSGLEETSQANRVVQYITRTSYLSGHLKQYCLLC